MWVVGIAVTFALLAIVTALVVAGVRAWRMDRLARQSADAARGGDQALSLELARKRMAMTRKGRDWLRRNG